MQNTSKYISQDILNQCFEFGRHNSVDKVVCGNGFSTAFLQSPVERGKKNIIIAPNLAVILSKEKTYKAGELKTPNEITFHHQGSTDILANGGDDMMSVVDSFILQLPDLIQMAEVGLVSKILIDESHTIEQSASYRRKLRDFKSKIEAFIPYCSIVSVTATPNRYSKVDIRIVNAFIKPIIIYYTKSKLESLNRIIKDLKKGCKVYVATNDWNIIYTLKNPRTRVLEANFIVGETMLRSLAENVKIIHNPESNLVIGSSRSFEGMDLMGENWRVYFFESRYREYETFYISNLYQAISRPRKGAEYIEYCRSESIKFRKDKITQYSIDKFVKKSISTESKMSREYKDFHPFVIFECDNKTGVWSIKQDEDAFRLLKESRLYDAGFSDFSDFLNDRKITIENLNEAPIQLGAPKVKEQIKIENLFWNKDWIREKELFGVKYRLDSKNCSEPIDYIKAVEKYLRNKNYDGEYELTEREEIGRKLLSDNNWIKKCAKGAVSRYNQKHKNDPNKNGELDKEKANFKKYIEDRIRRLILLLINNRINEYYTEVGNRQYSNIVQCPSKVIIEVCQEMGVTFTQVDIRTAYSRIIYAINGLPLPDNFYGENKKNKKVINILLNNFCYDRNKKSTKPQQKFDAKEKFGKLGFDEKVINWLIENFFETEYRSNLFNYLAWYEKQIVNLTRERLNPDLNDGYIRKHDELMIFNNEQDLSFLNYFQYLGQGDWFEIDIQEEEDDSFF